jgi:hypothetical protein
MIAVDWAFLRDVRLNSQATKLRIPLCFFFVELWVLCGSFFLKVFATENTGIHNEMPQSTPGWFSLDFATAVFKPIAAAV